MPWTQLELPGMPAEFQGWIASYNAGPPVIVRKWRRCSWCQDRRAIEGQEFCRPCLESAGTMAPAWTASVLKEKRAGTRGRNP